MGKAPAFQFYPADFDRDTLSVSLQARGAWITLLGAMWFNDPRGTLTMPLLGYARRIGATVEQTASAINELLAFGVCTAFLDESAPDSIISGSGHIQRRKPITALHVTDGNLNVTLICRRMDREEKERKSTALRVQKYRERHKNDDVTSPSSVFSLQSSSSCTNVHEEKAAESSSQDSVPLSPANVPATVPKQKKLKPPEEIETVRRVILRYPPKDLWQAVARAVTGKTEQQVRDAYEAWRTRGYAPTNFSWLEWLTNGIPPPPQSRPSSNSQSASWKMKKIYEKRNQQDKEFNNGNPAGNQKSAHGAVHAVSLLGTRNG